MDQSWDSDKITEVLSSGDSFVTKEVKTGAKLYGFDTEGHKKDMHKSAYWLDEDGYNAIQKKTL